MYIGFKKVKRAFLNFIGNSYFTYKKPMFYFYHPEFHKVKGYEIREILNKIQPGDILFRNHDGYLSSIGIPGFWSHVGLYVGDNIVIHAIGEGVVKEDILDFCRTDHIGLKRVVNLNKIKGALKTADVLCQQNTKYDFDFKDDNGKVYCSEFIDICYDGIFNDEYKMYLGKKVLTPQNIYDSKRLRSVLEFKHE